MKPLLLTILLLCLIQQGHSAIKPSESAQPQTLPEARILGLLDGLNEQAKDALVVPEIVRLGEDFQMTITTTGGGCERAGDTSVITTESSATVMVYDFTTATRPGIACTMIFKQMPHTVTLRFSKPGEAVLRVWGRRIGTDTPPSGVPIVLERKVMVK